MSADSSLDCFKRIKSDELRAIEKQKERLASYKSSAEKEKETEVQQERTYNLDDAKQHLRALFSPLENKGFLEIRPIPVPPDCYWGEYKDIYSIAGIISAFEGRNIYVSINTIAIKPNSSIKNDHVWNRYWLPFDFDPKRETGIPSTAQELEQAQKCADWFISSMKLKPNQYLKTMSGNGVFLLVRINPLQNNETNNAKIDALYSFWKAKTEKVFPTISFDSSVKNPARIMKLAGTLSVKGKGKETEARPLRVCRLDHCPETFEPIDAKVLLATIPTGKTRDIVGVDLPESKPSPVLQTKPSQIASNRESGAFEGSPNRDFPALKDGQRIPKGGHCDCCGSSEGQCLTGRTPQGHDWGGCWRPDHWGKLRTEGSDYKVFRDSMGDQGTAVFWRDKAPMIVRKTRVEEITWGNQSKPIEKQVEEILSESKEPKGYAFEKLPEGFVRTCSKYFVQQFKMKNDGPAIQASLALCSLLKRNRIIVKGESGDHTRRVNPWFLLIGPSGCGKSSLWNQIEKMFREMSGLQFYATHQFTESGMIGSLIEDPNKMFLFRLDEWETLYSSKMLNEMTSRFLSWKAGDPTASNLAKNAVEQKGKYQKTVPPFQFQIAAQTTSEKFFNHATTDDCSGGFLGRFVAIYDDDTRLERFRELKSRDKFLEICERTGGMVNREDLISEGKALCDKFADEQCWTIPEECDGFILSTLEREIGNLANGDAIGGILQRLSEIVQDVAILIDISRNDSYLKRVIRFDSVQAACWFVIPEFRKWFSHLSANLEKSDWGKKISKVELWLEKYFDSKAEEKTLSSGQQIRAITLSRLRDFVRGFSGNDELLKVVLDISKGDHFQAIETKMGVNNKGWLIARTDQTSSPRQASV